LLRDLLNNDNLVKALMYDSPNFLSKSIPIDFDRTSLLYNKIWPIRYVPNIQDKSKSIVMTHWSLAPSRTKAYFISEITFFIIVHFDLIRTEEGLRTDFIYYEIDKARRNVELLGTSSLRLTEKYRDFAVDSGGKWLGASFGYSAIKQDVG